MNKNMNKVGMIIVITFFVLFYLIANFFLERRDINRNDIETNTPIVENNSYNHERTIINNLYQEVRILYDVVNNKFKVDQDDTIVIGDITYKKITNFNETTSELFTENGRNHYVDDLGNYFAYTENGYYLAGNLVSYQTYYFRGDNTQIFITDSSDSEINGIIYEKWTSNNKNTIATVKVVNIDNKWLIDNINILATE